MGAGAIQSDTQVEFLVLRPEHVDGAVDCLAESFMDEPVCQALGLPQQALADFLRPRIELTAQDGLSCVTLENGKVVSTLFNDNNHDQAIPYANESQWKQYMDPIFEVLEQLHHGSEMEQQMHAEGLRFFHIFFGGTIQQGRRKGYLKRLMGMSLDIARDKGFDVAMAEATSPGSQHTCRTFGFVSPFALQYADIPALASIGDTALELHLHRL